MVSSATSSIPTSPPWLAAETGHLPEVFRITKLATSQVWADAYSQGTYVAGKNDVAAMPSLHTALTTAVALTLWRLNRFAGIVGWLYVAAMGISLVYFGEHYVVDVLAGILVALLLNRLLWHRHVEAEEEWTLTSHPKKPDPTVS